MPIFAPADLSSPGDEFHFFQALPTELRLKVWRYTMKNRRIINVLLWNRVLMDNFLGAQRPMSRSDERYGVIVDGYQTISKIFRISRESREAALEFYRVHLPCWFRRGTGANEPLKEGMFYFNPDLDFLSIRNDGVHVAELLHDLKVSHDPDHVGLLNLATDANGVRFMGGLCEDTAALSEPIRQSFKATLSQIGQVFFIQEQEIGRHVFGWRSGASTAENYKNLSFPITARSPTFDILGPDPRELGQGLSKFFILDNPCDMINNWRGLCQNILGHDSTSAELNVLLTSGCYGADMYTSQDAEAWLLEEERIWIEETVISGDQYPSPEPPTAFGFWIFPADAFARGSGQHISISTPTPCYVDLSEFRPNLALQPLPSS